MKNINNWFMVLLVTLLLGVGSFGMLAISHTRLCNWLEVVEKENAELRKKEQIMSELASKAIRPEYGMTELSLDAIKAWSASLSSSKNLPTSVALPERTYNGHDAFYPMGRDIIGKYGEHYRVVNALRVFSRYGKTHYEPALIVYLGTMEGGLTRIDMKTGEASVYYQGDWKSAKFSDEFAQNVIRDITSYFQDSPSGIPRDL